VWLLLNEISFLRQDKDPKEEGWREKISKPPKASIQPHEVPRFWNFIQLLGRVVSDLYFASSRAACRAWAYAFLAVCSAAAFI
jgi:hypothetical protein